MSNKKSKKRPIEETPVASPETIERNKNLTEYSGLAYDLNEILKEKGRPILSPLDGDRLKKGEMILDELEIKQIYREYTKTLQGIEQEAALSKKEAEENKKIKADYLREGIQYELYLDGMLFPVAPGKISTKIKNKNEIIDLACGGELNIVNDPGLTSIEFTAWLPNRKYPFAQYQGGSYKNATAILNKLEELKIDKKKVPFVILRNFDTTSDSVFKLVTLEEYEILEDAENLVDDFEVDIRLLQYKPAETAVSVIQEKNKVSSEDEIVGYLDTEIWTVREIESEDDNQ